MVNRPFDTPISVHQHFEQPWHTSAPALFPRVRRLSLVIIPVAHLVLYLVRGKLRMFVVYLVWVSTEKWRDLMMLPA